MTFYDDGAPERLWHYTSGAGAKGIFQSKTLWAGHLGYMNDTSEFNHAMNLSNEVVQRLRKALPEQYQDALGRWTAYVTDSPPKSWAPNVFAVSFSEAPDLLSQWRGYATGAGGPFCIGIPSSLLQARIDLGEGLMWSLRKCIYVRDEQADLIEERIRRGLESAAAREVLPARKTREDLYYACLYSAVMDVAPLCKHPDFAEEREWRLLYGPVDPKKVETVHFVERRDTLAPYIEFPLTDGDDVLDDIRWIAGPGTQQDRANSALGMVARLAGMTGYQGWSSQTPYLPA